MCAGRSAVRSPGSLPTGKLHPRLLRRQIERIIPSDARVNIGPRYGDDATAIDLGDRFLICACDPITLVSKRVGRFAVLINANDIAVMGAQPRWFWATILLPEHASGEELVDDIFSEMRAACGEIGASICGGHTEITGGLTRPILCGFMAGEVEKGKLADKRSIRPGDEIILSRGIAIEGTAAVASEMTEKLAGLDPDLLRRARGLFMEPGISVVREALLAARTAEVHGMHDPTEGGLFTGLRELAEAGGVGMEIEEERIPVLPETEAVCARLGIDPMGLLASGALLIAVGPDSAGPILEAYRDNGIPARVIGRAREREFGVMLRRAGELVPLPEFERDEIARVL